MTLRLATVSGSLRSPSTTAVLLDALAAAVAARWPVEREAIELAALAPDLAAALAAPASPALEAALSAVAAADLLVVATPVYRGSYTGLFKQFFDALHQDALAGTPVLLAAGGGSDQHSLVIDHELRPLFAFFRAVTLPVGVYAKPADFAEGAIAGERLPAAIETAVTAALPLLNG